MATLTNRAIKVAVSGIPRGYHYPLENGNWLQAHHKEQITAVSPHIQLLEIPAHEVEQTDLSGIELVLAEGGNRTHYAGELDWEDYQHFFTPALQWVQLCSTGFSDNITPQVLNKRVTLTNAPGLHTIPIAESVLAAMLAHAKNFKQRRQDQQAHRWRQLKNGELQGQTVLILGLGRIGKQVAQLCHAFGMHVIGSKRRMETVTAVNELFPIQHLNTYLPQADYIVIALPLTSETENVLDKTSFQAMKSTTYLINVGRGKVVDEAAMIDALQTDQIAGAYLDALSEEPLPAENPLWELENVFLVPHDSHSSPYIGDRMVDLFCANLARYVAGQPLHNICDPQRGY
ncbi:MAG: D-2-hydroxyacid dehydrogenase [Chloroflexi bacterium]|nr:D-2-hydroxyacid dehydrogenase [Chloroflexota bacterium]